MMPIILFFLVLATALPLLPLPPGPPPRFPFPRHTLPAHLWCVSALAHTSSLDTDLTRNTRAPHFTPQHWLLCHMGLYKFEFEYPPLARPWVLEEATPFLSP